MTDHDRLTAPARALVRAYAELAPHERLAVRHAICAPVPDRAVETSQEGWRHFASAPSLTANDLIGPMTSIKAAALAAGVSPSLGSAAPAGARVPIGGAGLDLRLNHRFLNRRFLRLWRPGSTVSLYVAGCAGTRELAKALKLPLFKIGVHDTPDVSSRMRKLSKIRYASGVRSKGGLTIEPGYDGWSAEPALLPSIAAPGSPVSFAVDRISVTLPAGMSPGAFDQKIYKATAASSLLAFVRSATGQRHCAAVNVDLNRLMRFTPRAGRGGNDQLSYELMIVRPKYDADRIIRVAEDLVYDHVMGGRGA